MAKLEMSTIDVMVRVADIMHERFSRYMEESLLLKAEYNAKRQQQTEKFWEPETKEIKELRKRSDKADQQSRACEELWITLQYEIAIEKIKTGGSN